MTDAPRTGTPWTSGGGTTWRRLGRVLAGLLALALVTALVTVWWIDRSIERVDVSGLGELPERTGAPDAEPAEAVEPEEEARRLTVLVLGSDSREGLTEEQRREFGTGEFDGDRSEVISLVRLDPDAEQIRVLSIPRDSRVERCDGTVGKINGAFEIGEVEGGPGGASCAVETVSALTGIAIDHVVIVDFEGFVEVVDDLGGVEMYFEEPLQDDKAHLDLPAGCVHLDGVDALAFVRARGFDNDFGRMERQLRLVSEMHEQLGELGVFSDLPRLVQVASSVARSVEVDSSLDLGTIQRLVRAHRSTLQGDLEGRSAPGEIALVDGVSYVLLDEERLDELTTWLRAGQDPAEADVGGAEDGTGGAADAGGAAEADGGAAETDGGDDGDAGADGTEGSQQRGPAGTERDPAADC